MWQILNVNFMKNICPKMASIFVKKIFYKKGALPLI
jgi:hypothetical protein